MSLAKYATSTSNPQIQHLDFNRVFTEGNDADKKEAADLLGRIHGGLYSRTFPIPSEQEALEDWLDRLDAKEEPTNIQFFAAYGKNLGDPDKEDIAGFIVSEYYKGTGVGLINYVIRDKAYKDVFGAKEMADHHVETIKKACWDRDHIRLLAPLWEANDPLKMLLASIEESDQFTPAEKEQFATPVRLAVEQGVDLPVGERKAIEATYKELHGEEYWEANDCMDPSKRISHIESNFGAKKVGVSYAQAPLEEYDSVEERADMTCEDLKLYVYDADSYPDFRPQHLKKYLDVFAKTFAGAPAKELGVESLTRVINQLDTMEAEGIPLMSERQTPAQERRVQSIQADTLDDREGGSGGTTGPSGGTPKPTL